MLVMMFGTFDHVHKGHIKAFNQARKYGDSILVVIARDRTIENIRGFKLKWDENKRRNDVSKYVDKTVLGYLGNKHRVILKYKPDVICLGYDQVFFINDLRKFIKENKLNTKIVRLKAYKPNIYKSSKLKYNKL